MQSIKRLRQQVTAIKKKHIKANYPENLQKEIVKHLTKIKPSILAQKIGISSSTMYVWQKKYPLTDDSKSLQGEGDIEFFELSPLEAKEEITVKLLNHSGNHMILKIPTHKDYILDKIINSFYGGGKNASN